MTSLLKRIGLWAPIGTVPEIEVVEQISKGRSDKEIAARLGCTVRTVIAHGQKIHTIYIHLDSLCVKKGDKVKKGQYIGKLGRTGLCTGPNLHWGFVVNRVHVDPRYWIKEKPEIKKGQWIQYKKPED